MAYDCNMYNQSLGTFSQVLYTRYEIPLGKVETNQEIDQFVYRVYGMKVKFTYDNWEWSCKKSKKNANENSSKHIIYI